MTRYIPVGERIVCKEAPLKKEQVTKGGIVMPTTHSEPRPRRVQVVEVIHWTDDVSLPEIRIGSFVWVKANAGRELPGGHLTVDLEHVLAVELEE